MFTAILLLGSLLPDIQATILLEDPSGKVWVTEKDAMAMKNPQIRKALIRQIESRKLVDDDSSELFKEKEMGAWVIGLHIARQGVHEQREKKKKGRVID